MGVNGYVTSRYLRIKHLHKNAIYNFLLNKYQTINKKDLEILYYCKDKPQELQLLLNKFDSNNVFALVHKKQLLNYTEQWTFNYIKRVEIETSTVCNWKCEYCPVKYNRRKPKFIDKNLFCDILDKCVEYKHVKLITLHSYNEPTIDPNFTFYFDEIQKRKLHWLLYTNGSFIDEDLMRLLKKNQYLKEITINIPSMNKDLFSRMTGADTYNETLNAIRLSLKYQLKTSVSIQGNKKSQALEANNIKNKFPQVNVITYGTEDRAGSLKNEYQQNVEINDDRLSGCFMNTERACLSVEGDLILCCNDFYQKKTYGNIQNYDTIEGLLQNNQCVDLRKIIWGEKSAPSDFICRNCIIMNRFHSDDGMFKIYNQ